MVKKGRRSRATRGTLDMLAASFDFSGRSTHRLVAQRYGQLVRRSKGDWAAVGEDMAKATGKVVGHRR